MTMTLIRRHAATVALAAGMAMSATAVRADTTVHVALLDMSSMLPAEAVGYGMMGQGQGAGMMGQGGQGYGMMGGMMTIRVDQPSVKAGPVTFDVTNWSRGVQHEMVVIATKGPSAPLPYDYNKGVLAEDQLKVMGEASDLEPNVSTSLTLDLPAGHYLLVCNLPGHFAAGMAVPFDVTP